MDAYGQYKVELRRNNELGVFTPSETDVLCGKGEPFYQHPGNIIFRKLVHSNKQLYDSCPNSEKHIVGQTIVETLEKQQPPVRFLEVQSLADGNRWVTLPRSKAIRKTAKALREHGSSHGHERHTGNISQQSKIMGKRNWADSMVENANERARYAKQGKNKQMKPKDEAEEPSNDEAWEWLLTNLKPLLPFSERNPKPEIIEPSPNKSPLDKPSSKESGTHANNETEEIRPECAITPLSTPLVRIVSNEPEQDTVSKMQRKKNDNCDVSVNSLDTIEDCYVLGSSGDNSPFNDSQSCFSNVSSADCEKQEEWSPPGFVEVKHFSDQEATPCTVTNSISDDEDVSIPDTTEFARVLEQVKYNANNVTDDEEASQQSYDSYKSATIIDLF